MIRIEFCEKWNYFPDFDRVSSIIKEINPNAIIVGNKRPPRSGAFEVEIDGELVFSKLKLGTFPDKKTINSWFQ